MCTVGPTVPVRLMRRRRFTVLSTVALTAAAVVCARHGNDNLRCRSTDRPAADPGVDRGGTMMSMAVRTRAHLAQSA